MIIWKRKSFFKFYHKFYIQVDGVAIGFLLGPILAHIFLSHHEENWLNKCPIEYTPSFYRRYNDDIFKLYESSESAYLFREYMSSKHQNINFTVLQKNIGSLLFLEVKICRKNGKFVLVFTENQYLVGFSQIMKVSFQHIKKEVFYAHYFTWVLAHVVISRHFILKLIIWRLSL